MASRRKNGEGSWGTKKIHGDDYVYYRDIDGKYYYGRSSKIVKEKIKQDKLKAKIAAPDIAKQTFGEYMLAWLESIRTGIEATTYQSYLDAVNARLVKTCVRYAEEKKDIEPLFLDVTVKTPSEANVSVKKKEISIPSAEEVQIIYEEAMRTCANGARRYGNAAYVKG